MESETPPEVRKHYYLDQYVIISPGRSHVMRRGIFKNTGHWSGKHPDEEEPVYELKDKHGKWTIRVIKNLHPALSPTNRDAFGFAEVVLDANPMDRDFSALSVEHLEALLNTYCQRISALHNQPGINYVSVFHNTGWEAGASARDSHSQIIATGVVPPEIKAHARRFTLTKKRYGHSPLGLALNWEIEQRVRLIHNDHTIGILAPFASQWPYEAWLVPKRAVKSICQLKKTEIHQLAKGLKAITGALEHAEVSYNFMLAENIKGYDNHFMIRVIPRPNVWAGFEYNTGIAINPVSPEAAAEWYREFIRHHAS